MMTVVWLLLYAATYSTEPEHEIPTPDFRACERAAAVILADAELIGAHEVRCTWVRHESREAEQYGGGL